MLCTVFGQEVLATHVHRRTSCKGVCLACKRTPIAVSGGIRLQSLATRSYLPKTPSEQRKGNGRTTKVATAHE